MSKPFTVKELIVALQKVDENLPVGVLDPDMSYWNVNQLQVKDFEYQGKYLLIEGDSWFDGKARSYTKGCGPEGTKVDLSGEKEDAKV